MDFLREIEKETILIVPSSLKIKVLEAINSFSKLIPVKIYSFSELKRLLYFDYDKNAILYLMDHYHYQYEVAQNYLENLYYVEDKSYSHGKLQFLVQLKKELVDASLLHFFPLFSTYCSKKEAIVFGYDAIGSFERKILSSFSSFSIIEKKKCNTPKEVYSFSTLEEEVLFLIQQIIQLKEQGISLNQISLVNVQEEYYNDILRLFPMYHIPVDISPSSNLLSTILIHDAVEMLRSSRSFSDTLNMIREKYDLRVPAHSGLYVKFLSVLNQYMDLPYSFETIFEAICYDLKNMQTEKTMYREMVRVVSLQNQYFGPDDYVFLVNFQQGVAPKIYKDEEYITDILKDEVDMETCLEKNKMEKRSSLASILAIPNLVITYKLHHMKEEYYPSNFLTLPFFVEKKKESDDQVSYSKNYSMILLADMIDQLIKYDKKNPLLALYYHSLSLPYLKYNNRFFQINCEHMRDFIGRKLILSYSNLNTFYQCQFRYYLDNILSLNRYEETFSTLVGSLFHFVLSKAYQKNFDLEREYSYYLRDRNFSVKEEFFLLKLKKELAIICDQLHAFYQETGLTNILTEKNISIDKSTDIDVIFKGIVDKIMYHDYDGKTLVSIIDYKTGYMDIDITRSFYGIGMQLPIYLYLINKSKLFENPEFVGFYLQKILSGEVGIEKGKSYLDLKREHLKLYGYSTTDSLSLERFDPTYESSEFITGMKYGKNGISRYAKVLSNEEMEGLTMLVDQKIDFARDEILKGNFAINPKKFSNDKEVYGCKYCRYQDICFRKNEDIVTLEPCKDLNFLKEGDDFHA